MAGRFSTRSTGRRTCPALDRARDHACLRASVVPIFDGAPRALVALMAHHTRTPGRLLSVLVIVGIIGTSGCVGQLDGVEPASDAGSDQSADHVRGDARQDASAHDSNTPTTDAAMADHAAPRDTASPDDAGSPPDVPVAD